MIIDFNLAIFTLETSMTFPDQAQNALFAVMQDWELRPISLSIIDDSIDSIICKIDNLGLDINKCQVKDQRLNTRISRMSVSANGRISKIQEEMREHLQRLERHDQMLNEIHKKLMQRDEVSAAPKPKPSSST